MQKNLNNGVVVMIIGPPNNGQEALSIKFQNKYVFDYVYRLDINSARYGEIIERYYEIIGSHAPSDRILFEGFPYPDAWAWHVQTKWTSYPLPTETKLETNLLARFKVLKFEKIPRLWVPYKNIIEDHFGYGAPANNLDVIYRRYRRLTKIPVATEKDLERVSYT
jgi:hypothetical protein